MKTFRHWSASQVEKFRSCERQWWWRYIYGIAEQENQGQADGKLLHAEAEDYLVDGKPPKSKLIQLALSKGYLPAPGRANVELPIGFDFRPGATPWYLDPVQHVITQVRRPGVVPLPLPLPGLTIEGVPVSGFIDMLLLEEGKPVILDHKFLKDMKWAKSEEELFEAPQMIAYAKAADELHQLAFRQPAAEVSCGHIVYQKTGSPTVRKTVANFNPAQVEAGWNGIVATVKRMKQVALETDPIRVSPNWNACSAYRGCQHRERCEALKRLNPAAGGKFAGFANVHSEVPMSLLTSLRAKGQPATEGGTAAPSTTAPAAPAKEVAVVAASGATPAGAGILAKLREGQGKATTVNPPDAAQNTGVSAGVVAAKAATAAAAAPVATGTPAAPVAAQRKPRGFVEKLAALNWSKEQAEKMSVEAVIWVLANSTDGKSYSVRADGSVYLPKVGPVDTSTEDGVVWDLQSNAAVEEAMRLGWSEEQVNLMSDDVFGAVLTNSIEFSESIVIVTDAEGKITDLEAAPEEVAAPVVAPVVPVTRRGAAKVAEAPATVAAPAPAAPDNRAGLVLYIDSRPAKGPNLASAQNLEDVLAPLMARVAHEMKVPHYSMLDYGEGNRLVAALATQQTWNGVIVADTRFPATMAVLEVIKPLAVEIHQGGRW